MKIKYNDNVFRLKNDLEIKIDGYKTPLKFKRGEEIHIVKDVVYMNGYKLENSLNRKVYEFIDNNLNLFVSDNRNFK